MCSQPMSPPGTTPVWPAGRGTRRGRWYLRIAAEELLGLHLRGGVLYPEPRLPAGWPECAVRWRDGAGLLHTIRLRPDGVTVDEKPYDGGGIGKKRPKPYSQDR